MLNPADIARIDDILVLYRLQDAIETRIAELSREDVRQAPSCSVSEDGKVPPSCAVSGPCSACVDEP